MMKSQNGQEVHLSPMHSDADMDKNRKKSLYPMGFLDLKSVFMVFKGLRNRKSISDFGFIPLKQG